MFSSVTVNEGKTVFCGTDFATIGSGDSYTMGLDSVAHARDAS